MKHLLACLIVLFAVGCKSTRGSRSSNVQAVVANVEGSAEFLRNGTWQPIRAGHVFGEGDQARTGANGRLDLQLTPHGGVMSLMPDSAMQIEQLGTLGTNQQNIAVIRLSRDRVIGDTLKLPKGSKVAVKTNAGTFAIP
jgi:hypothetical protein